MEVREKVFMKIQPYRLRTLAKCPNEKLSPRFYGPFRILEKVSNVAYKLDLPSYARLHLMFYVSQLKRLVDPTIVMQPLSSNFTKDMELIL